MLSVLITARNEQYLERTIRNVLSQSRGDIEVLVALDGYVPDPRIEMNDDRVIFYHFEQSIGQRQAINYLAKQAKGKYIMKLDAHCALDEGFDTKLAADCEYDWTVIPRMYNLDVSTWEPKLHKRTDYMYISSPYLEKPFRMEYFTSRRYREEHKKEALIDDTMCCVGCCWFLHKDRYWDLGGLDEKHGGWGQMGIEIALKAWLSGGALKVNKKTWFAHYFRGHIGFPYEIGGRTVEASRKYSRKLWLNDGWDKATKKLKWLVDKFNPPCWGVSAETLKNKHEGKTCYIVGRGPSILSLNGTHFKDGVVIAINEAIEYVEPVMKESSSRDTTTVYSMQKDREFLRPEKATLLLNEQQSKKAHPDYPQRIVFDTIKMFGQDTFSAKVALGLAKSFGCDKIKMLCFDSHTTGDLRTVLGDKFEDEDNRAFTRQNKQLLEYIDKEGLDVEWVTPTDKIEEFRVLDYRHIITKQQYPRWRGHKIIKHPGDLVLYHQAIWNNRPDYIVETGTRFGGSGTFYADMLELTGKGMVISVDIDAHDTPPHPRITYIKGSSRDKKTFEKVRDLVNGTCMVILDSDHTRIHVKWELHYFSRLVTSGQYLVVEDCYLRGRNRQHDPGKALDWFLSQTSKFKRVDVDKQFLSISTRGGWTQRK